MDRIEAAAARTAHYTPNLGNDRRGLVAAPAGLLVCVVLATGVAWLSGYGTGASGTWSDGYRTACQYVLAAQDGLFPNSRILAVCNRTLSDARGRLSLKP